MYQVTKDNWGNQVENYGSIPFVDMKTKPVPMMRWSGLMTDEDTFLYVILSGYGIHAVSFRRRGPCPDLASDFYRRSRKEGRSGNECSHCAESIQGEAYSVTLK